MRWTYHHYDHSPLDPSRRPARVRTANGKIRVRSTRTAVAVTASLSVIETVYPDGLSVVSWAAAVPSDGEPLVLSDSTAVAHTLDSVADLAYGQAGAVALFERLAAENDLVPITD